MITTINEFKKINEELNNFGSKSKSTIFTNIIEYANDEHWFSESSKEEIKEAKKSLRLALSEGIYDADFLVDEIKYEWLSDENDPLNLDILKTIIKNALTDLGM